MSVYRRARAHCACGRDVSRDTIDTKAKSVTVRCTCGADLDVGLDRWWWVSYRYQGRVRRLRVAPDRRAAERKERGLLIQVADGVDPAAEKIQSITLPELADRYWKSPAGQRRREGYADKDRADAAGIVAYLGGCRLSEITTNKIEGWVESVKDELQPGTVRRRLGIFSSVLGWAVRQGYLPSRPRFPTIKVSNARNDWATPEQARALLAAITNDDTRDAVELALSTGMRRGEVVGLEWPMVNLEAALVSLPASLTKSGKARSIPLNKTAQAVLRRRLAVARPGCKVLHRSGRPFHADGLSQSFKRVARKVGLDNLCLHSCRHTCASWLVQAGVDLMTTAALLGHSSLAMTARYSHLSPDGLRAAVAAAEIPEPATPGKPASGGEGVRPAETKVYSLNKKAAIPGA